MKYSLISRDWIADCIEIMHSGYTGVRQGREGGFGGGVLKVFQELMFIYWWAQMYSNQFFKFVFVVLLIYK